MKEGRIGYGVMEERERRKESGRNEESKLENQKGEEV